MNTITVTIGRNVGDVPLPDSEWIDFVNRTRATVAEVTDDLWVATDYTGEWNGTSEDAFVFYGPLPTSADNALVDRLRVSLGSLATYYGQEAIGLSLGASELVETWVPDDASEAFQ
jgi:hypothetical protein